MKNYLVLLFMIISVSLWGQEKIPKGINKIVINTELKEKENMNSLIKVLREKEYSIRKIDSTSFQIETSPKKFRNWSYTYYLIFNIFENKITVSSKYNTNTGYQISGILFNDGGGNQIITKKNNKSFHNIIFQEMRDIVLEIVDESKITYNFIK
jgi:hypothetical protein